jgi:hypothetical protein
MHIKRSYGVYPTNQNSMLELIGPNWTAFKNIFPVYFYSHPADMVVQVRLVGTVYETATLHLILPITVYEKEVDNALATEGVFQAMFEKIPEQNVEYLYDLRKGKIISPNECFWQDPPKEACAFIMWSMTKNQFFVCTSTGVSTTFSVANYISQELNCITDKSTVLGKQVTFVLVAASVGDIPTRSEMEALPRVDFPAGAEPETITKYSEKTLSALEKFKSKKLGKLKTESPKPSKISLQNIVTTNNGIPKGLVYASEKQKDVKFEFEIDTFQDTIEEAFLKGGKLFIKLFEPGNHELYTMAINIFKVAKIDYLYD